MESSGCVPGTGDAKTTTMEVSPLAEPAFYCRGRGTLAKEMPHEQKLECSEGASQAAIWEAKTISLLWLKVSDIM